MAVRGVLGIGVVAEIGERGGVGCGAEEVDDVVHADVERGVGRDGGEGLGGEGRGEERDAGDGGDGGGGGLLLGVAGGDRAAMGADVAGTDGVSAAEGGRCGEGVGAEGAAEEGEEGAGEGHGGDGAEGVFRIRIHAGRRRGSISTTRPASSRFRQQIEPCHVLHQIHYKTASITDSTHSSSATRCNVTSACAHAHVPGAH